MAIALWALPKDETDRLNECVLTEGDSRRCDEIEKLAAADGWHGFRRQVLDGSTPDFVGAIRGIKRNRRAK
jgi:hypothetical protein